jgi:hypothetical protein
MGLRDILSSPSRAREQRYQQASALLARHGFVASQPAPDALKPFLPWAFYAPSRAQFHARGAIDEATVDVFEYEHTSTDSEGNTRSDDELVAMIWHPRIAGAVRVYPDHPQWGGAAAVIDALMWVPPFVLARGIAWAIKSAAGWNQPDRIVGHPAFDRLYVVNAASDDEARRALTPALRELLLRMHFRGTIEVRPGLLMVSVPGAALTIPRLGLLMEPLPALLAAVLPQHGPYR